MNVSLAKYRRQLEVLALLICIRVYTCMCAIRENQVVSNQFFVPYSRRTNLKDTFSSQLINFKKFYNTTHLTFCSVDRQCLYEYIKI